MVKLHIRSLEQFLTWDPSKPDRVIEARIDLERRSQLILHPTGRIRGFQGPEVGMVSSLGQSPMVTLSSYFQNPPELGLGFKAGPSRSP